MNEAIRRKHTMFVIYINSTDRLTYKEMNTRVCIKVTTKYLFDHYRDPRNNKRNANHNTTKNTNIQGF